MVLPRYVAFKSKADDLYLKYVKEDVQIHGYIKYDAHNVVTPHTKYEVEPAKVGKGYVNIRCCYNNKYWVCPSINTQYVVAVADEPNEDQSNWACTLFEPIFDPDHQAYRIKHVYFGYNTCSWRDGLARDRCLYMGYSTPDANLCDLHVAIDWESFYVLPKYVAFKGDNGNYLQACWFQGLPYLQFSADDIGDPKVGNEVSTTNDGNVRIKSNHFGKLWRRSPNWIWADSNDTTGNNKDTLFWPVKVDNKFVALRNLGNNYFCKRLTTEGKTNCLNAGVPTITKEARLEIQELVLSRSIYNVIFHLLDARIYGQHVITMANGDASNNSNKENSIDMKLRYTISESNKWCSSVSAKVGVQTSIQTGIPLIAEGKIEMSAEFSGEYTWGETKSKSSEIETVYTVTVPPMSRVRVSLLATKGQCDVPYSYAQRDTLMNGDQVTNYYDDGIYTAVNCYNFKYETKQEPL
ncbi:hypothetical protein SDJN03_03879, partial [Cucurbita argyrosperma subsp. sororia]